MDSNVFVANADALRAVFQENLIGSRIFIRLPWSCPLVIHNHEAWVTIGIFDLEHFSGLDVDVIAQYKARSPCT